MMGAIKVTAAMSDPNPDPAAPGNMQFISEPIAPERSSFSTDLMAQGLASLPAAFTWRNRRYQILECLAHVKQSTPEGGVAGNERYLRRQEFHVMLDSGQAAIIYVQRQPARGSSRQAAWQRWFLLMIEGEHE